jgi:hypothetical protein
VSVPPVTKKRSSVVYGTLLTSVVRVRLVLSIRHYIGTVPRAYGGMEGRKNKNKEIRFGKN